MRGALGVMDGIHLKRFEIWVNQPQVGNAVAGVDKD